MDTIIRKSVHNLLDYPLVYNCIQKIASIGRMKAIRFFENKIREEARGKVCDVGCGTGNYSKLIDSHYFGVDLSTRYLKTVWGNNKYFICADAASLPFANEVFDTLFSIGFFHHIDDVQTKKVLLEIRRTIKRDARVVIVDIFYPESRFNIIGYLLCRFDRGRFVRKDQYFKDILKDSFVILETDYIPRSFPQNMRYFLLKRI